MCWSAKDYQRVDFRDNDVIADRTVEPLRPASNQSVQIRFLGYISYSNTVIIPKLWSSGNCVIKVPFTLANPPPPPFRPSAEHQHDYRARLGKGGKTSKGTVSLALEAVCYIISEVPGLRYQQGSFDPYTIDPYRPAGPTNVEYVQSRIQSLSHEYSLQRKDRASG